MTINNIYECNGGLYPMISRRVKYIPGNVYNQMKEIFIKIWKDILLGIYSSEDIHNFTDHEISESNMKCDLCITNCGIIYQKH